MIKILGKIIVLICFNLTLLQAGSVTSTVESTEILQGESVILSITIVGQEFDTLPNIPEISGSEVLGSNRSIKSRIITVDGKATMEQTAVLMLEFRPTTNITIPAFQVSIDGEIKSTKPIEIKIVKSKPKISQEAKFLIEMNSTKESVIVGEPFVVNVYFKQKKGLNVVSIDYKEPSFKKFFSKRIGEEKSYEDGNYSIQKLTYLLTAKEEGNITIQPATVRVAEEEQRGGGNGWFGVTPKWSSAQALATLIQVENISESFDIMGRYHLKESIDTQKIEANKPVNLKLMIEGEGSLEDFEGLTFDIAGVTVYSDDAKIESKVIDDKLFSRYTKSYVFISDHDFEIPSKEIVVYDYHTKTVKTLGTKSYKIVIDGETKDSSSPAVYTKNSVDVTSTNVTTSAKDNKFNITWQVPEYLLLFLSFMIGGVMALLLRPYFSFIKNIKLFKSKKSRISLDKALVILYPHMNDSVEVEEMTQQLYDIQQGKDIEIDRDRLEVLLRKYRDEDILG